MAKRKPKTSRQARRRKRAWIAAAVAIAVVAAGGAAIFAFGGESESPRRSLRQAPVVSDEARVTVDVVDSDYEPRDLTIRAGATVVWDFTGKLPHTITNENGEFDSGTLSRGEKYELAFHDAGTYTYYCTLHHVMRGSITVTE